jgi:hypothetical protein
MNVMFFGKTINKADLMLMDPSDQAVSYADVKGAISFAR